MKSLPLYITAFVAGFVIMALELLGFRVLAPYFGYSIYVSGSLIGIVLAALSVGYMVGGRIADRWGKLEILWGIILAGSAMSFLGGLLHRPVLGWLGSMGPMRGALLGSVILFGPTMVLLSMVSPFIIRMVSKANAVGRSAGDVYGVATVGSIAGVFLTSFWLIPAVGGTATFNIAGVALLLTSVAGFVASGRYPAFAGLALLAFVFIPEPPPADGVLVEKESLYTRLAVVEKDGVRRLSTCRDKVWWSLEPRSGYLTGTVFDSFLIGPIIAEPARDVLVLGMGGGTSVKQLLHFFPGIGHIDAVDIDPEVVRLADEYFDVKPSKRLSIHVADARVYLSQTDKKYDFIEVDLFHQGPYIPFYVATKEFFELVRSRLKDGGVMIYNVLAPRDDGSLLEPIGATVCSVFPSVLYVPSWELDPQLVNVTLIAVNGPASLEDVKTRISNCLVEGLEPLCVSHYRAIRECDFDGEAEILVDDHAPIEQRNFALVAKLMEKHRDLSKRD